ncbi:hypothetical protein MTR67_026797 [Solanum verrucosum]|uniref:Integrase catalytic domain-containing protein n=1 Tax=Solanum verrucosum TaxID=315347 RepID=A0AAF0TUB1_SOLVR|nr:hypothetical protein MTR67_026797 [Solanum verrucosum]
MDSNEGKMVVMNGTESSLVSEVKEKQDRDPILLELKANVHKQKVIAFEQRGDGVLRYQEHQRPDGMAQNIEIPEWKWEMINIDFITERFRFKGELSTAFHPQTDGQVEHTILTLEDMFMASVIDFKGNWDDHLPVIEFAYNNSYHSSIQMV